MGSDFEEVCWRSDLLKEAPQLTAPSIFPVDDPWERSQDTETINELSQDSEAVVDLKPPPPPPHNTSSESQDSLTINANTTPKRLENTDICISPFHAGHMENAEEGNFALLGESPKRRLGDSSAESSPKRIHLGCTRKDETAVLSSSASEEEKKLAVGRYNRVISVESTSENNGQIFNLEECHVVPRIMENFDENPTKISSNESIAAINLDQIIDPRTDIDIIPDQHLLDLEKLSTKARHASIDSAIDSGIGDSCNSVDSTEANNLVADNNETKIDQLERRCWQPKIKESLAARLPGNFTIESFHSPFPN